jgi:glycosyltransferase involved in cell wall biosynthesis
VVVIPARDEEHGVAQVLAAIPLGGEHGADRSGFVVRERLVVDNGSRDATAAVARRAGARVVSESTPGYGAACLAGLAALAASPPDVVAFLDADDSDDPRQLGELLAPILEGRADLVIGSRTLGEREAGSLTALQILGNWLATRLMSAMLGGRFTDLGPFRAIRWASLVTLGMRDRDYGWTVEMQARALRAGLRCAEVPVRYRRRAHGRSKVSGTLTGATRAGVKILATIGRVRFERRPPARVGPMGGGVPR